MTVLYSSCVPFDVENRAVFLLLQFSVNLRQQGLSTYIADVAHVRICGWVRSGRTGQRCANIFVRCVW